MRLLPFKRKSPTLTLSENYQPCLQGEQILAQGAGQLLQTLRSLVSVSTDIYRKLYLTPLYRVAEFCQAMPVTEQEEAYSLLRQQLERCINTLKMRRGALLPPNAGAEQIAEQEPAWTYALFSVSLLYGLHRVQADRTIYLYNPQGERKGQWHLLAGTLYEPNTYYALSWRPPPTVIAQATFQAALAARILSPTVINWMAQAPLLLRAWWAAISDSSDINLVNTLINKAQAAVQQPTLTQTEPSPQAVEESSISAPTSNDSVPAVECNSDSLQEIAPAEETPVAALLTFLKETYPVPPQATLPWLRVEQGLLVSSPVLQEFLALHPTRWQNDTDFMAAIKASLVFENEQFYVRYSPIAFEDQRMVEGILIKAAALDLGWQQQPSNPHFQPALML